MLSNREYVEFQDAFQEILDECYLGTDSSKVIEKIEYANRGYTSLTSDTKYLFTEKAKDFEQQLIDICNKLPVHPPAHIASCGAIAYADLLPDDMTSKEELMDACELADAFFILLELNRMGLHDNLFKSKYGFQLFSIDLRLHGKIKPNTSAYVPEDAEPNI